MIGKLQSNKAKDAVKLFDYIHSLDNQKLADALAKHQINLNKNLNYFIQVNIGNEIQKSGIPVSELDAFYNYCINEINLNIIGLNGNSSVMNNAEKYFKSLNELNKSLALERFKYGHVCRLYRAIKCGSTFVRIGALFLVLDLNFSIFFNSFKILSKSIFLIAYIPSVFL